MLLRSLSILFFLFSLTANGWSQFGLRLGYDHLEADHISIFDRESAIVTEGPGTAYSIGLDYWFRLPKQRIEFYPELNVARSALELPDGNAFTGQWYSFFFNTHIYLLDLLNDCNCPTFSKQRNLVQRGFFFSVSPGVTYGTFTSDSDHFGDFERKNTDWILSLSGGLGLDIGLSDLITLTPFAEARYLIPFKGPVGNQTPNDQIPPEYQLLAREDSGWRLRGGLRFGFRFDYR